MSSDLAVRAANVGKCFHIYEKPRDRLKQTIVNRVHRVFSPLVQRMSGHPMAATAHCREFWALKDVSFEVRKGESLGIIGRNGSGKSTLLQIVAGTMQPTEGAIDVNGRVAALLELGSGFNPEFTGRENVYVNAAILGLTKDETDAKFDEISAFADIGDFIEQPVRTYSSGMMLRLAFAVQSTVEPDLLIIDEALAVGDMRFSMKCIRKMRELIDKGTSCLFVSHDMSSVANFCSEVMWLHDGQVFQKGQPKSVTMNYANYMMYGLLPQEGKTGEHSRITNKSQIQAETSYTSDEETPVIRKNATDRLDGLQWVDVSELSSTGAGGATISRVAVSHMGDGSSSLQFIGGEIVQMFVEIRAHVLVKSPIVAADARDRKGNLLFGLNTYFLNGRMPELTPFSRTVVRFSFEMPPLLNGEYSISLAIADGDYESHVQHHLINEALAFTVCSESVMQRHYLMGLQSASYIVLRPSDAADSLVIG